MSVDFQIDRGSEKMFMLQIPMPAAEEWFFGGNISTVWTAMILRPAKHQIASIKPRIYGAVYIHYENWLSTRKQKQGNKKQLTEVLNAGP